MKIKLIFTLSREVRKCPIVEICTAKPVNKGTEKKKIEEHFVAF